MTISDKSKKRKSTRELIEWVCLLFWIKMIGEGNHFLKQKENKWCIVNKKLLLNLPLFPALISQNVEIKENIPLGQRDETDVIPRSSANVFSSRKRKFSTFKMNCLHSIII